MLTVSFQVPFASSVTLLVESLRVGLLSSEGLSPLGLRFPSVLASLRIVISVQVADLSRGSMISKGTGGGRDRRIVLRLVSLSLHLLHLLRRDEVVNAFLRLVHHHV